MFLTQLSLFVSGGVIVFNCDYTSTGSHHHQIAWLEDFFLFIYQTVHSLFCKRIHHDSLRAVENEEESNIPNAYLYE
jgi:hypothetical protein